MEKMRHILFNFSMKWLGRIPFSVYEIQKHKHDEGGDSAWPPYRPRTDSERDVLPVREIIICDGKGSGGSEKPVHIQILLHITPEPMKRRCAGSFPRLSCRRG
jgi:hypothetical protein